MLYPHAVPVNRSINTNKTRICVYYRRSQRTFKLSANYDHRLDAKASSTGLRRHWILKAAKCAHKVCDLHTCGSYISWISHKILKIHLKYLFKIILTFETISHILSDDLFKYKYNHTIIFRSFAFAVWVVVIPFMFEFAIALGKVCETFRNLFLVNENDQMLVRFVVVLLLD